MPDLDAVRARHFPEPDSEDAEHPEGVCDGCMWPWPCDTAIVLAALNAALERERVLVGVSQRVTAHYQERERRLREALEFDDRRDCYTMSRADYAALAETPEAGS